MKNNFEKVCEIAEQLGWTVEECDGETAYFSQYSPAGEDFGFDVSIENAAGEINAYYEHFDIDEHVGMWIDAKRNGTSGIPSIRELCDDAEEIGKMLEQLANAVCKIEV